MNASTLFKQAHKLAKQAASNDRYSMKFGKALSLLVRKLKHKRAQKDKLKINDVLLIVNAAIIISFICGPSLGYVSSFLGSFFLVFFAALIEHKPKPKKKRRKPSLY